MDADHTYLTTKQVAERLGRSVRTVDRMIKSGVIPRVYMNKRWYISSDVVEAIRRIGRPSADLGRREVSSGA
jgi:excisionase family DNA binding protein